jgi:uncharacterized protein related to proFAR isomerase
MQPCEQKEKINMIDIGLKNIENKIDKMQETTTEIKVSTALNTQNLVEHMRRTALLEVKTDSLSSSQNKLIGAMLFVTFISPIIIFLLNYFK